MTIMSPNHLGRKTSPCVGSSKHCKSESRERQRGRLNKKKREKNGESIIVVNGPGRACPLRFFPLCLLRHSHHSQDHRSLYWVCRIHSPHPGSLHGSCWIIPIQLFSFWSTFLRRDSSPCCLSPYSSEQRKQRI